MLCDEPTTALDFHPHPGEGDRTRLNSTTWLDDRAGGRCQDDILSAETLVPAVQLLRTLDAGEALDVSGLPDQALRARLVQLLNNLDLRRTRQVLCPRPL